MCQRKVFSMVAGQIFISKEQVYLCCVFVHMGSIMYQDATNHGYPYIHTYVYEGRQTKRICISIQCSDSSTSSLMISSATYYLFIRHHHHPQSNHLSPATTVLPRRFVLDELVANANICMRWMDAGQVESDRISRNVALLCIKQWLREKWSASELLLYAMATMYVYL